MTGSPSAPRADEPSNWMQVVGPSAEIEVADHQTFSTTKWRPTPEAGGQRLKPAALPSWNSIIQIGRPLKETTSGVRIGFSLNKTKSPSRFSVLVRQWMGAARKSPKNKSYEKKLQKGRHKKDQTKKALQ